jgi:DNA (cytosine-5)-methyltransferase 1
MQTKITHGSLFSGIGGFDYAGELCGIKTLWVCEIKPAPVAILRRHFPDATQLGNILEVHGGEIAPVDVLTFGSPCQGMSVAGTRCGLDSDQSESVLFYEAVRIIYEMREATNGEYPKIIIWENVPGAYSSNKGLDFRAVLETLTKSTVPMPKSGRWATSGMVRGGAVDIAWRTPDAQYWGVPQRRKRIKLIGDFTGGCAAKLLFECDRLSGYFAQSREQRQGTATDTEDGTGTASGAFSGENHANDSRVKIREDGTVQTLTQRMGAGGGNVPLVMQPVGVDAYNFTTTGHQNQNGEFTLGEVANTLNTNGNASGRNAPIVMTDTPANHAYSIQGNMIGRADKNGPQGNGVNEDVSFTLTATDKHAVAYALDRAAYNQGRNAQYGISIQDDGISQTMVAAGPGAVCAPPRYIVRRLTPIECERLQGFPSGWTEWGVVDWQDSMARKKKTIENGKLIRDGDIAYIKIADTARYEGLGNAVDIPTTLAIMATVNEYLYGYYGKEQSDEQSNVLESEDSIQPAM